MDNEKTTPIPTPDTTVALKVGSKFMDINWRVTQTDMDNGGIVPVEREGTAYAPVKAVVEAFGGTVTEDAAILGEKILKLNTAVKENGAVMIPVSAFAETFRSVCQGGTNHLERAFTFGETLYLPEVLT